MGLNVVWFSMLVINLVLVVDVTFLVRAGYLSITPGPSTVTAVIKTRLNGVHCRLRVYDKFFFYVFTVTMTLFCVLLRNFEN